MLWTQACHLVFWYLLTCLEIGELMGNCCSWAISTHLGWNPTLSHNGLQKNPSVPMLYVNIAQCRGGKARCFHLYPLVRQSLGCSQGILALQKQATCPRGEHAARNTWGWALWHGFFSAAQKQSGFYTQSSAFFSAPGFPLLSSLISHLSYLLQLLSDHLQPHVCTCAHICICMCL